MAGLIILAVIVLFALLVITKSFKVVGQAEVMVIERLGRFHRVARSGLNILIPFVELPRTIDVRYFESDITGVKRVTAGHTSRIDLREQVLNFPSQPVITKDNVTQTTICRAPAGSESSAPAREGRCGTCGRR